jgi:hypothetical protein
MTKVKGFANRIGASISFGMRMMILEMFFMLRIFKELKEYIQILYLDCMIHQREVILKSNRK